MATWVVEGRYPVPGGAWYNIGNFADLTFRKEVNTKGTGGFTAYIPIPPAGGLKLHYDMEKLTDAGQMRDLSDAGNHGTMTGTADAAGKYGRARIFNGTTDIINAPAVDPATTNMTIAGWAKWTTMGTFGSGVASGTTYSWQLYSDNTGKPRVLFYQSIGPDVTTAAGGPAAMNDGNWHHLCGVLRSGRAELYVDGILVATAGNTISSMRASTGTRVGWEAAGAGYWTSGLDEIYIYNRALDISEILDVMNASAWDLLQNNNEIRFRETVANKEWIRGRIRDRVADEVANEAKIGILDNSVLLADAKWIGHRVFPALPAISILDELANSAEGEPKSGQVLRWDGETLDTSVAFPFPLKDFSGRGNVGAFSGSAGIVDAKWGYGLNINGTGTVSAADSATLDITGSITIAAWLKSFVPPGGSQVFYVFRKKLTGANAGYEFYVTVSSADGTISAPAFASSDGVSTPTFTFSGFSSASAGVWHHFAFTIAGGSSQGTLYVDGVPYTSNTVAYVNGANAIATTTAWGSSGGTMLMDELCVYNRVLTSTEIKGLAGQLFLPGGIGSVDPFTIVGFRAEDEQRLSLIDTFARAVDGEWYIDQDANDKDRLNIISRIGTSYPSDVFQFGVTAVLRDRKYDTESVVNDWVIVGNDGTKKLKGRNFQATTLRTTLSTAMGDSDTTATVVSTTGFPSTGVLYVGGERMDYTGKTGTTFTGITRAYTADGYSSLSAYGHSGGIEIWLHADKDPAPDVYYTPVAPQNDSSIKRWGLRSGTYTEQFYNDQSILDCMAQRMSGKFKAPRESVVIDVYEEAIVCDIGDFITLNDENGVAYFNSPYRVFAMEYHHDDSTWTLEIGNYRDTFDRRMSEVKDDATDATYYAAEASTKGTATAATAPVTVVTTTEKDILTITATGIKAGDKVFVEGWAQLQTGTNTTTVTARIRRGSGISGGVIGGANAMTAAAASTYEYRNNSQDTAQSDDPVYTFTLQQAGATANGTSLQASLRVSPVG